MWLSSGLRPRRAPEDTSEDCAAASGTSPAKGSRWSSRTQHRLRSPKGVLGSKGGRWGHVQESWTPDRKRYVHGLRQGIGSQRPTGRGRSPCPGPRRGSGHDAARCRGRGRGAAGHSLLCVRLQGAPAQGRHRGRDRGDRGAAPGLRGDREGTRAGDPRRHRDVLDPAGRGRTVAAGDAVRAGHVRLADAWPGGSRPGGRPSATAGSSPPGARRPPTTPASCAPSRSTHWPGSWSPTSTG